MGLDIRVPIGLMFTVKGIILILYGLRSDPAIYQASLGININLIWGAVMLVFGLGMLALSRLSARKRTAPHGSPLDSGTNTPT